MRSQALSASKTSCETTLEAKEGRILRAENLVDAMGEQSQKACLKVSSMLRRAHDSTTGPSKSIPKWKQFVLHGQFAINQRFECASGSLGSVSRYDSVQARFASQS
jgi:hypothetical protein